MAIKKSTIQSGRYGKSFIERVWNDRGSLDENEKRGFAQFFYINMCSHIEDVLMTIIEARLNSINTICEGHTRGIIPSIPWRVGNDEPQSTKPLFESMQHITSKIKQKISKSALSGLIDSYNEVFPDGFDKKLRCDLEALAALRNIFAHGRAIFVEFDTDGNATLEKNPLEEPTKRLKTAGIITEDITSLNYSDSLIPQFFSDEAMFYFYSVVKDAEMEIRNKNSFCPESSFLHISKLPELSL
ncbi:MAG: hypothetical protein PHQ03_00950 [Methylococcales bacterium]|nr:hypothetical protein [Methylococcales bacterium]